MTYDCPDCGESHDTQVQLDVHRQKQNHNQFEIQKGNKVAQLRARLQKIAGYRGNDPIENKVPFGKKKGQPEKIHMLEPYAKAHNRKLVPDKPKQKDFSNIITAKFESSKTEQKRKLQREELETIDTEDAIKAARIRIAELKIAKEHNHHFDVYYQPKVMTAQLMPGTQGKYAKYWLLNAKQINGNGWGVDPSTIDNNIQEFVGMPFVVTAQEWHPNSQYMSQYVHPYIPTNNLRTIFAHQEKFRVGTIVGIIKDADQNYYAQIEKLPKFAHMNFPPFCSPGIYQLDPRESQQKLSKWFPLHLAGLMEDPAYGPQVATLKGSCIGTKDECRVQFSQQKYAKLEEPQMPEVVCPFKAARNRLQHIAEFDFNKKEPENRVKKMEPFKVIKHDEKGQPYKQYEPEEHDYLVHKTDKIRPPKPTQKDRTRIISAKQRLQKIAFQRPFRKFFIHPGDEGEEDVEDYDPGFKGKPSGYGVGYSHPQHLRREYGENKIKSFKDMDEALTRHNLVRAIDEDVNGTKTRTLHIGSNPSPEQIDTIKNQFSNSPHPVRAAAPSISRKYHTNFESFQKHLTGLKGKTPTDVGNKAFKTHTQELSARLQKIASQLGEENMTYQDSKKIKLKKKLTKLAGRFDDNPLEERFKKVKKQMEEHPDIKPDVDQISEYVKHGKPFNPSKTASGFICPFCNEKNKDYDSHHSHMKKEHPLQTREAKQFNPSKTARYNIQLPSEVKINPEHGAAIAQAYGQMKHDPQNPEVKSAYGALIGETKQQYNDLIKGGLKVTPSSDQYKNSKEMHEDIEKNNHLKYFPTQAGGDLPQDHPMAQPTDIKDPNGKPMIANDVFRIVHDINGHHLAGKSGFGPRGEHQAYLQHKTMYSPLANKALFSETAGQNNYVNFGPNGEHNRKNPAQTIYAPQKAGVMPDTIINGAYHQ